MIIEKETAIGKIAYSENSMSGKKSLSLNGETAQKTGRNTYVFSTGETASIKGNFLTGVTLSIESQEIVLMKNKWYEWVLIFLPFTYLALGLMGGAIGGGLSGLFAVLTGYINAGILRGKLNVGAKVMACLFLTVVMFLVWFGIYILIVGGLASAFPAIFGKR